MSDTFTFEPMTIADYAEVIGLWRGMEGVGLNDSDSCENIARYLVRNPGLSFVARAQGKVIGAVLCGHDGRRGYMHHLAVAKGFRKNGIGRSLVQHCFEALKAADIPKCNIFVYADNENGKAFWKHEGWVDRGDLRVLQKMI